MDFDFVTLYEKFSNIELLRILLQADQYHPEAVQAANDILSARNVTDEERQAAGYSITEPAAEKNTVGVSTGHYTAVNADVLSAFEPEVHPRSVFFKISFALIGFYYARLAYNSALGLLMAFRYDYFSYQTIFFQLFYLFVMPFAMVRLYLGKKDGWYISFVETTFTIVPMLIYTFNTWRYNLFNLTFSVRSFLYVLDIFLKPYIFFFFLEKTTADHAGVNTQQKKITVFVCLVIMVIWRWLSHMINSGESF